MLSINFSSKAVIIPLAIFIWLSGCAQTNTPPTTRTDESFALENNLRIAVFPLFNLSGNPVPLKDIRQRLISRFQERGISIVADEAIDRFLVKHRIRYIGGIDEIEARDLRYETGAEAVLLTAVELYSDTAPPKFALTSRLVSTGNNPEILWMDGIGLSGDDSIGLLQLSLIEDPKILMNKGIQQLSGSLVAYLSGRRYWTGSQRKVIKFWPKVLYRSPSLVPEAHYTVAVVPFYNLTDRNAAGEIMALHFVRQLRTFENFSVVEPGIIRQQLLQLRIIMDDGISLASASALFGKLNVDLILAGKVFDYQDYRGVAGKAKVDFSALLIDRFSREVIWAVESHHQGDYGVFFFDWGEVKTAYRMASEMVLSAVETMVE